MSASQRKNYFIAKDMQSKFAGTILLLTLLVAVITACNIYVLGCFFVEKNATLAQQNDVSVLIHDFVSNYWPRLVVLVCVNVIIVFMVSVIYSHQTAGPAYKLEKSIKRITEGDLTFQVSLRRNDNLKELAAALNELLDKFRTTISKTKSLTEDINNKLGSVKGDEKYAQIVADSSELRQLVDQFKLEPDKDSESETEEDKTEKA
ncbi:MAG: methyl-accepting chemotaxis protein [Candidatus Riflebacteria bacterium]|nr:methyl-accepting chemotaxis protein [Candidatus Riflebacteria bacterium]